MIIEKINLFVWSPVMLCFLVGTGVFLSIKLKFVPAKNIFYGLYLSVKKDKSGSGDISPFQSLMTTLASTIGTGNIVGIATAMVLGGPGAIVWMWISTFFGLSTKFAETFLAVKYREKNEKGEMAGGPMFTMKNALKNKKVGKILGTIFAFLTVCASFGIGNMTQANSISSVLNYTFNISSKKASYILAVIIFFIILGGIKTISKVTNILVPVMGIIYFFGGIYVIIYNRAEVPDGIKDILITAFSKEAIYGGTITTGFFKAFRWGIARGVFSTEAGMGSGAIAACAATTDSPIKQGYINMTGAFIDMVICTITGLIIASSGVLGTFNINGEIITGSQLTINAFETALGGWGNLFISISIILFAFSTIVGWEYNGEKAFEFIIGNTKFHILYKIIYGICVYLGGVLSLNLVWSLSDIANGLMAIPNLISLILLYKIIKTEIEQSNYSK